VQNQHSRHTALACQAGELAVATRLSTELGQLQCRGRTRRARVRAFDVTMCVVTAARVRPSPELPRFGVSVCERDNATEVGYRPARGADPGACTRASKVIGRAAVALLIEQVEAKRPVRAIGAG
jgi:hypothetical protein